MVCIDQKMALNGFLRPAAHMQVPLLLLCMNERPLSRILSRSYDHPLIEGIRVVTLRPPEPYHTMCHPCSSRISYARTEKRARLLDPEDITCLTEQLV